MNFFDWVCWAGRGMFSGQRWSKPAVLMSRFGSCALSSTSTVLKTYIPRIGYAKPNLYNCHLNFCLTIKGSVCKVFLKGTGSCIYKMTIQIITSTFPLISEQPVSGNRSWTLPRANNRISSDKTSSVLFFLSLPSLIKWGCVHIAG